ncbi:MAG: sensor domain-containing diguanylate cyclase [Firmicutes bacterium]|nr:sensor domain-containing diguanylate cyclase [Bacillota bacterium]
MKDINYLNRIILITGYLTKAISIFLIALFIISLFSEGGHLYNSHFDTHDIVLFAFVPLLYGVGAFYSFKSELVSGIIIFISFIGYNVVIRIVEHLGVTDIQYSFLLIPAILFAMLNLFKRYNQARIEEFKMLFGEYEHLNQNYKIVQSMLEITPEMLKDDNLDSLLQLILQKAIDIIPKAQTGSILIKNNEQMVFRAAVGYDIEMLKKVDLHFEDMFQYKLGNLYEPTVIRDIRTFNNKYLDPKKAKGLEDQDALIAKSVLTCAIIIRDEIYGFINLDNIEDFDAFQDKDKIYIKHLAHQIEMALKNQMLVEDIYKLSRYDSLTGAYVRKHFLYLLKDVYEKARKNKSKFSICTIDINELKPINDQYGHESGDAFLIHFSKIVQNHLGDKASFSRTGGDEFVIVYSDCDQACAMEKISALREHIEGVPFILKSKTIPILFGCGIATYPEDSEYLDKLISLSDQRMYLDKKHRK